MKLHPHLERTRQVFELVTALWFLGLGVLRAFASPSTCLSIHEMSFIMSKFATGAVYASMAKHRMCLLTDRHLLSISAGASTLLAAWPPLVIATCNKPRLLFVCFLANAITIVTLRASALVKHRRPPYLLVGLTSLLVAHDLWLVIQSAFITESQFVLCVLSVGLTIASSPATELLLRPSLDGLPKTDLVMLRFAADIFLVSSIM